MEIIIGILLYLLIIGAFTLFGQFLKECDDSLFTDMNKELLNK